MKYWVVVTVLLLLIGCGGDTDLPQTRPSGKINGHVVDAPIIGAEVKAYSFINGRKGGLLATTVTNGESYYELSIQAPNQPILLEIENGIYTEEASGTSVTLQADQTLKALFLYQSDTERTVNITPYTHLLTGLAEYHIGSGDNVETAIGQAMNEVAAIWGLNVHSTTPLAINKDHDNEVVLDEASFYGFMLAGLSGFTDSVANQHVDSVHSDYPTIAFAQLMYEDIKSDGIMNGMVVVDGENVQLFLGNVGLDDEVYRRTIPQHMLTLANSPINKTGINPESLLSRVNSISNSGSPLIPNSGGGTSLDIVGPVISANPPSGPQSELIHFQVVLEDDSEIASVRFDLDGADLGAPTDLSNPFIIFDSRNRDDGEHQIGVRAEDSVGNMSYQRFPITIDNTAPVVTVTSSLLVSDTDYDLTGSVVYEGAAIASFDVVYDGEVYPIDVQDRVSWTLPLSLDAGRNQLSINVTDVANNRVETPVLVSVDRGLPIIISRANSETKLSIEDKKTRKVYVGDLLEAEIDNIDDSASFPAVFIEPEDLTLGENDFTEILLFDRRIPYLSIQVSDSLAFGVSTPIDEIKTSIRYSVVSGFLGEWVSMQNGEPTASNDRMKYLVPLVTEVLGQEFAEATLDDVNVIDVKAEDAVGNVKTYSFMFRVDINRPEPPVEDIVPVDEAPEEADEGESE